MLFMKDAVEERLIQMNMKSLRLAKVVPTASKYTLPPKVPDFAKTIFLKLLIGSQPIID